MKKNELVHLHALLVHVRDEFVARGVADEEAFEPYRALGVSPLSMRVPRDRHEEAVRTLARLLAAADDDRETNARRSPSSPRSP